MRTPPEVIDSLNVDLAKEHGAIIQYLLHAGQVRDTVLFASIMENAREEMWHFEWLVEAIRERGGTATLDRQEGIFTSEGIVRSLEADIDAESDALAHYEKTLETIGDSDDELSTLVQRIMDDERYHRETFARSAEMVGAQGEEAFRARPEISPTDAQTAGPMIGLEYEGLLQYLWNHYGSPEKEDAEAYFELAVNEMRHLRWVATCMGGLGVPAVPPDPKERIAQVDNAEAAHDRAERYERKAADVIARVAEAVAGETIASQMRRIGYQHGYHRFQLEHMEQPAKTSR